MCRELARAVGELRRTIGDAFSPYRPELHYMRGPGPKCRVKRDARAATTAQPIAREQSTRKPPETFNSKFKLSQTSTTWKSSPR